LECGSRQIASTFLACPLIYRSSAPSDLGGVNQWEGLAERIERIGVEHHIGKWQIVGHDAGSAVALHYATGFTTALTAWHCGCVSGVEAISPLPDHQDACDWRVARTRCELHFLEHRD